MDGARVLLMGLTFKENCSDLRNTRAIDIIEELKEYNCQVDVYDPMVSPEEAKNEYNVVPIKTPKSNFYDGIILAVAHDKFSKMGSTAIRKKGKPIHILYDLKYILSAEEADLRL